jgi:hypothetical protein
LTIIPRGLASADCPNAIDQADVSATGAHAIYLKAGAIEIIDSASSIGDRPGAPPPISINDVGTNQ